MGVPETRYAKRSEARIAYQVTGKGPFAVVWVTTTRSAGNSRLFAAEA